MTTAELESPTASGQPSNLLSRFVEAAYGSPERTRRTLALCIVMTLLATSLDTELSRIAATCNTAQVQTPLVR